MERWFLVGLGGLVGTLLRYWIAESASKRYGENFPLGTLVVNSIGCLLAGFLFYLFQDRIVTSPTTRAMVFVGLLGGFTTFSAYGLQTFTLLKDGQMFLALVNVLVSNLGCLLLVWAGYCLARLL